MTLDEVISHIKSSAKEMDARYGQTVFDEWAVLSLAENKARVLAYIGPRNDDFLKNFAKDLGVLRAELLTENYGAGDFEFARQGTGTSGWVTGFFSSGFGGSVGCCLRNS